MSRIATLPLLALVGVLLLPVVRSGADESSGVVFSNVSGADLFLRVQPSAAEETCLDDGYRTVQLPADEEVVVELEGSDAVCWCAVAGPRDSCAFPETAHDGESVVVETAEGD